MTYIAEFIKEKGGKESDNEVSGVFIERLCRSSRVVDLILARDTKFKNPHHVTVPSIPHMEKFK